MKSKGDVSTLSLNGRYEVSILVDNKPIHEYYHEGSVFIEGRSGSEYKIRIKNNTSGRVCFVVSVDGLSVLNGKECSSESPGYLLKPWEALDIACYKVDDQTGAKFVFGSKDKSYSAEIGKGTDNVGVIAAMVFQEKPPLPLPPPIIHHWYGSMNNVAKSIQASAGSHSTNVQHPSYGGSTGSGWSFNTLGTGGVSCSASTSATATMDTMPPPQADDKLGTVFGDAMLWHTQTVIFNRDPAPVSSLVIYYDSKKNLERRGVRLEQKVPPLPNPFPANEGCPVPHSWHK